MDFNDFDTYKRIGAKLFLPVCEDRGFLIAALQKPGVANVQLLLGPSLFAVHRAGIQVHTCHDLSCTKGGHRLHCAAYGPGI